MNSKLYSIHFKDILHGFITAFATASFTGITMSLEAGHLPTLAEVKTHALIGLAGGLGYLFKKFISNSDNKILVKDEKPDFK